MQCGHWCGLSPLWIFLCLYKLLGSASFFPHTSQATAGLPFAPISPVLRGKIWSGGFLATSFFAYYSLMCKNETGLTYIEHNVSCVGNKITTFRKDNRCMIYKYHIMMLITTLYPKSLIDASSKTRSAITYLIPPIGCFSDFGVCFESSWLLIGGGLCLPALRAAQAILGPRFWPRGACKGFLIKSNPSFSSLS